LFLAIPGRNDLDAVLDGEVFDQVLGAYPGYAVHFEMVGREEDGFYLGEMSKKTLIKVKRSKDALPQ
jgi:hypothetical protein